ncbi:lactate utilization protein B/C [Leptobacterium flavescens]|uniref:Lactate utilization protein B/C n=1 Tax=Leptobacterium flavescens TaxID=472055 RepID=A0A6P0UIK4_9FLAO|nr:LUD domain-containing protein [Leptobacterium flavescens]NER12362.1 lactate utilization protein B/C [Leptobacterium flavescens]
MSLFKKIFGLKSKRDSTDGKPVERGKYMPEIKLPVDEKFTINFKKNGGKFIYCDSIDEILESFDLILSENSWKNTKLYCTDKELQQKFKDFKIKFSKSSKDASAFLTSCENLVADVGGVLISSNQIGEFKLHDLPDNFIVFAATSQLVDTIGEGLRKIKNRNKSKIPTNITTIKHFNIKEEKDFLSYGSSSKNLYLLLLEDL